MPSDNPRHRSNACRRVKRASSIARAVAGDGINVERAFTGRAEHALAGDFMVTTEAIKVSNEVLPSEKRGKKLNEGFFNGGDPP